MFNTDDMQFMGQAHLNCTGGRIVQAVAATLNLGVGRHECLDQPIRAYGAGPPKAGSGRHVQQLVASAAHQRKPTQTYFDCQHPYQSFIETWNVLKKKKA